MSATILITGLKLFAAIYSHSVSVLSEGIHSLLDLVSASLSFFTIREASKPADEDHPFGHEKIEILSSFLESFLLLIAAFFIVYEAIDQWNHPQPLHSEGLALGIMMLCMVISGIVFLSNHRIGKKFESAALQTNALHFLSDMFAGLGVVIGLVLMYFTNWMWVDPLLALGVGTYIFYVSFKQLKTAWSELSDQQIPVFEKEQLESILNQNKKEKIVDFKKIRTRKSGPVRHVDFKILVCQKMSVRDSHQICDQLEQDIEKILKNVRMSIHVEPCIPEKQTCLLSCPPQKTS